MKVNSKARPAILTGENGETLTLRPSNMGEPFREGMDFTYQDEHDYMGGFFELRECGEMRDFLNRYLASKESQLPMRHLTDCLNDDELDEYRRLSSERPYSFVPPCKRDDDRLANLKARMDRYQFAPAIPDLSSLQRYECDSRYDVGCMDEESDGTYVKLQDVRALLAKISMEGGW